MKTKHIPAMIYAAAAMLLASLACAGTAVPTESLDSVSTMVAETLRALTPLVSPTAPPSSTPFPTSTSPATPAATSSNLPAAVRINFAAGTTQNVIQGTVQGGQTLYYVVRAQQNQPLIAMLDSPEHDVTLSIFGADGGVLLPAPQQDSGWQGLLPSTQDYYFRVTGGGSTQTFTLNVIIAARIQFAAGQNKTILTGQTVGGFPVTYVARASGGQKMDVTLNTSPDTAALTIWGFSDGQPYARAQNGVTDFSMTLPSTQDYIIQVVPQGGQVVDYKVNVKIQ